MLYCWTYNSFHRLSSTEHDKLQLLVFQLKDFLPTADMIAHGEKGWLCQYCEEYGRHPPCMKMPWNNFNMFFNQ